MICGLRIVRVVVASLLSIVLVLVVGSSRTQTNVFGGSYLQNAKSPSLQFSRTFRRRRETELVATATVMQVEGAVPGLDERRYLEIRHDQSTGELLIPDLRLRTSNAAELLLSASWMTSSHVPLRC
ncbi:MAG: hypothetical protein JWM11_6169 [Planctomycetaceae bacterium]|nr:hypothetical protein [Planctomycetaceae bacterium]